ncbi:hypothetical protein OOU_Y34scaffold00017g1 [Pyricularia oryzae Y34]|uniref:Uncharacterized protein n=1 Tax=Pyricularia oryzae (strain Y34) TaxID=1143189 RepID=A0AA97PAV1_PYRO3|nr:hypothetical protein OOU_Y34scaffold00017g1 [Pyricularia oryzae Y34]
MSRNETNASTKPKNTSKFNDKTFSHATVQAEANTWSVCALLRHCLTFAWPFEAHEKRSKVKGLRL